MTTVNLDSEEFHIHFAALFSEKPDAIPIVLFHGWPGSSLPISRCFEIRTHHNRQLSRIPPPPQPHEKQIHPFNTPLPPHRPLPPRLRFLLPSPLGPGFRSQGHRSSDEPTNA